MSHMEQKLHHTLPNKVLEQINQLRILHDEMKCPRDKPDDILLIQEMSVTL